MISDAMDEAVLSPNRAARREEALFPLRRNQSADQKQYAHRSRGMYFFRIRENGISRLRKSVPLIMTKTDMPQRAILS